MRLGFRRCIITMRYPSKKTPLHVALGHKKQLHAHNLNKGHKFKNVIWRINMIKRVYIYIKTKSLGHLTVLLDAFSKT